VEDPSKMVDGGKRKKPIPSSLGFSKEGGYECAERLKKHCEEGCDGMKRW